jgi:endogenous inhibitor of DNA gyrase (YacG/DUF329 family)
MALQVAGLEMGMDGFLDDDTETINCPYCGREIYEDAPQCPHCGQYLSREDAPTRRPPWWLLLGVAVCLFIVYRWIVGWR